MYVAVIADDLTGAHEMGALLADAGLDCTLTTDWTNVPDAEAVVIDTESRHLPAEKAYERVLRAARNLRAERVFKKVDSTLRGPLEAELRALQDAFPEERMTFTPAYPKLGRTVRNGELFVHGEPVHLTAFARDPLSPVGTSQVPGSALDASTEEDLQEIARSCGRLAAGSGGLGREWARLFARPRQAPLLKASRLLVICGSKHPVSREQAARAPVDVLATPEELTPGAIALLARRAAERIASYDAVFVFGGDTAYALLQSLGVHELEPATELLPGVPVSRMGDRLLITKAGGFGAPDIVEKVLSHLT
jgi:uncharacterized protein YgbK (DUF1537 family)